MLLLFLPDRTTVLPTCNFSFHLPVSKSSGGPRPREPDSVLVDRPIYRSGPRIDSCDVFPVYADPKKKTTPKPPLVSKQNRYDSNSVETLWHLYSLSIPVVSDLISTSRSSMTTLLPSSSVSGPSVVDPPGPTTPDPGLLIVTR